MGKLAGRDRMADGSFGGGDSRHQCRRSGGNRPGPTRSPGGGGASPAPRDGGAGPNPGKPSGFGPGRPGFPYQLPRFLRSGVGAGFPGSPGIPLAPTGGGGSPSSVPSRSSRSNPPAGPLPEGRAAPGSRPPGRRSGPLGVIHGDSLGRSFEAGGCSRASPYLSLHPEGGRAERGGDGRSGGDARRRAPPFPGPVSEGPYPQLLSKRRRRPDARPGRAGRKRGRSWGLGGARSPGLVGSVTLAADLRTESFRRPRTR